MARSVSGVVTLEEQPFSTRVVAVSVEDNPRVLNHTTSGEDGTYFMNVTPWTGEVMVYAVQDYGSAWAASKSLAVGDVIHPTAPNGYIFKVTSAGKTGSSEPTWPAQLTTVTDGEVTYEGVRLLQPKINGYLTTLLDDPRLPPVSLFANGNEKGAWFDPSDKSSLFQDSLMTIPVTAPGQRVGAMMDKSGNGNHALQSDDARRPIYRETAGGLGHLVFNEGNTTHNKVNGDTLLLGNGATNGSGYLVDVLASAAATDSSGYTILFGSANPSSNWPYYAMTWVNTNQLQITTLGFSERPSTPSGVTNNRLGRRLAGWNLGLFVIEQDGTLKNSAPSPGTNLPMAFGSNNTYSAVGDIEFKVFQCIVLGRNYTPEERSEIGLYYDFLKNV